MGRSELSARKAVHSANLRFIFALQVATATLHIQFEQVERIQEQFVVVTGVQAGSSLWERVLEALRVRRGCVRITENQILQYW
jgi:hypothetical protein